MGKLKKMEKGILLYLKEAKLSIIIVLCWFLVGFIYYSITVPGTFPNNLPFIILSTFYLRDPIDNDIFAALYTLVGTIIISQGVFAFILTKTFEKYDPALACKMIAKDMKKPVVIFHHGHIGNRIVQYLRERNRNYIIVEEKRDDVEDLLDDGQPVIIGDLDSDQTMEEANIKKAVAVVCATDDMEKALVITNKVRKINPKCELLVRLYDDRLREVLEQPPYGVHTFSTSKMTIDMMKSEWIYAMKGKVLVIGANLFTRRLIDELVKANREVILVDENDDEVDFYKNTNIKAFEGNPSSIDFLESQEIGIQYVSQVFIGIHENTSEEIAICCNIRKKYPDLAIYMRVFNDDLTEFLEKMGVHCFSTSKQSFKEIERRFLAKYIK
jgi:Trk K+ transport system NAD-binding subunit